MQRKVTEESNKSIIDPIFICNAETLFVSRAMYAFLKMVANPCVDFSESIEPFLNSRSQCIHQLVERLGGGQVRKPVDLRMSSSIGRLAGTPDVMLVGNEHLVDDIGKELDHREGLSARALGRQGKRESFMDRLIYGAFCKTRELDLEIACESNPDCKAIRR